LVTCLSQEYALRLKPDRIEPMAVNPAGEQGSGRNDDQHRSGSRQAADEGDGEAEGGGQFSGFGNDVVQRPQAQPSLRQVIIDCRQVEGQNSRFGNRIRGPKQMLQSNDDAAAVSVRGKTYYGRHGGGLNF